MAAWCYCELRLKGRKTETKRGGNEGRKQCVLTPGLQMDTQGFLFPKISEDIAVTIQAYTDSI